MNQGCKKCFICLGLHPSNTHVKDQDTEAQKGECTPPESHLASHPRA